MKANTIDPKGLIVAHPNEEILLAGGTIESETTKQTEVELKIFKTTNLENLKARYYKSISYVFPIYSWKARTRYLKKAFWQVKSSHQLTDRFWQMGKDLKIFIAPSLYVFKR